MSDFYEGRTSRMSAEERQEVRAELQTLTEDQLYEEIQSARAMRKHPYATDKDHVYFTFRINASRGELVRRFRAEMDGTTE